MDQIFEFMRAFTMQDGFFGILGAISAGVVLIFTNVLSHTLIKNWNTRRKKNEILLKHLAPVIESVERLLARLNQILVFQNPAFLKDLTLFVNNPSKISTKSPIKTYLSHHESTALRLFVFLSRSLQFQKEVLKLPSLPQSRAAAFFLNHKIPLALRGNLFGETIISSELQEEIGHCLINSDEIVGPQGSISLLKKISDQAHGEDLYQVALGMFAINPKNIMAINFQASCRDHQRIAALAHLAVFLTDFIAIFKPSPQWDVQRFALVAILRHWVKSTDRDCYLYKYGDINERSYLDSFPLKVGQYGLILGLKDALPDLFGLKTLLSRLCKYASENARDTFHRNRFDPTDIWNTELRVLSRGKKEMFSWKWDFLKIYTSINAHVTNRLARKQT